jgi:hypothetical protein
MISRIATPIAKGIQSGAVTHHQDQSITLQSLRTRNTIKVSPPRVIPLPAAPEFLLSIIYLLLLS